MIKASLRIAFRVEGEFWCAYLAADDTMADAVLLGSIRMSVAQSHGDIKDKFMSLMQETVATAAIDLGAKLVWPDPPRPAPESERSGNA